MAFTIQVPFGETPDGRFVAIGPEPGVSGGFVHVLNVTVTGDGFGGDAQPPRYVLPKPQLQAWIAGVKSLGHEVELSRNF